MAKAFLEASRLSSTLPHCPLEHSSETVHRAGSNYSKCQKNTVCRARDTDGESYDLEAQMRGKRLKGLLSHKWAESK